MNPRFEAINDLQLWDSNFESGKGPMSVFLDLIGYAQEQGVPPFFDYENAQLGYLELDHLADALKQYAVIGEDANEYVKQLINMEAK